MESSSGKDRDRDGEMTETENPISGVADDSTTRIDSLLWKAQRGLAARA